MPALTVLEIMMEQYEDETGEACDWQLRTGRVEVSTKERLARKGAQRLKRYPIQDLITDVPNFDNGPRLDLGTALAQGSQQGGGNGSQSLFQGGSDDPDLPSAAEKAEQIIELIVELVESEGWARNGGDWASIRYHEGNLLIKAPDFVHRRVGGYPFRPARTAGPASITKSDGQGPRGARYTEGRTEIPGSGTWEAKLPERSPTKAEPTPFRQADATRQLNGIQRSGTQDTLFRGRWGLVQIQGERPSAFVVRVDQHQSFALRLHARGNLAVAQTEQLHLPRLGQKVDVSIFEHPTPRHQIRTPFGFSKSEATNGRRTISGSNEDITARPGKE